MAGIRMINGLAVIFYVNNLQSGAFEAVRVTDLSALRLEKSY